MKEIKTGIEWIEANKECEILKDRIYNERMRLVDEEFKRHCESKEKGLYKESERVKELRAMEEALYYWLNYTHRKMTPDPWEGTEFCFELRPMTEEEIMLVDKAYAEFFE